MNMLKPAFRIALAMLTVTVLSLHAFAQYFPYAPGASVLPGASFVPPPGFGYYPWGGGYWNGQAAMLDAYGNVGIDQEQARIMREQANQAKLVTRTKTIDVMAYERANKYWFSDEQADIQAKRVQAAMNNPPLPEVTSGRALNTLLPFLDRLNAMGKSGPPVPVDPSVVKSVNTTSGGTSGAGGNAGLLREVDHLEWPVATLGANQKKLDEMLKQATYEGARGPVSPTTVSKLQKQTEALAAEVKQKFMKDEIDGGDYINANRFLDRVRQANRALSQPDITQMLGGGLGPQGTTVDQIVESMTSRGLSFVGAQPGQEGAYVAMHRAFVNAGLTAGATDTAFRVRLPGGAGGVQAKAQ
jgi:hypothetical protein